MEAVLIQQKCEKALKGEGVLPVTMSQAEKTEMVYKARSAIVLYLGDKVLRDVAKEPIATSMLSKLESLYMTKSFAHRQFLKQQLYSFKMVESKAFMEQLTEFKKILDDLENIEVHLEDEDKAILLLCALPRSFESFKDTMLYGKEGTVTLEEVQAALRTKELTKVQGLES
jgi:exonuclease VII small subunit